MACGTASKARQAKIEKSEESAVKRGEREDQRQPVQPGQIAADKDAELKQNRDQAGDACHRLRKKVKEGNNQLGRSD